MNTRILCSLILGFTMATVACSASSQEDADTTEGAVSNGPSADFAPGTFELDSAKGVGRVTILSVSGSELTFSAENRLPGSDVFSATITKATARIEESPDLEFPKTATLGQEEGALHLDLSADGKTIRVRATDNALVQGVTGDAASLASTYRNDGATRFVNEATNSVLRIQRNGNAVTADLSVYDVDTDDGYLLLLNAPIAATGKSTIQAPGGKIVIELTATGATVTTEGTLTNLPDSNPEVGGTFAKY